MTESQSFVLSGAMAVTNDHGALLVIASALHRRGVDVTEAELRRPRDGVRRFDVTFRATPSRAEAVLRTVENLVDVLEAALWNHHEVRTAS